MLVGSIASMVRVTVISAVNPTAAVVSFQCYERDEDFRVYGFGNVCMQCASHIAFLHLCFSVTFHL